jgi:hypothetical protein
VSKTELFSIPDVGPQVGWRLSEQDKKDLRLLMADRREKSPTKLLRGLVQQEAASARQRWTDAASRIAAYDDDVAPDPAQDPDLSPEQ